MNIHLKLQNSTCIGLNLFSQVIIDSQSVSAELHVPKELLGNQSRI